MEREWTGNARRLSRVDRAQIERLIWGGETFAAAAAVVGCSTKSIQRYLALSGRLKRRVKERRPQPVDATARPNTSDGFIQFKVCRGRLFSCLATAFRWAAL